MKYEKKFPMLDCLFGAYFNQDWDLDYDSSEAVIKGFARDGEKKGIEIAICELKVLLKEEHTQEEWLRIIYDDFDCSYDVENGSIHPTEWLEKIQKQLEDELVLTEKKEKYPMIHSLFGAYFNPDWDEDYDSQEAVIHSFAQTGGKNDIQMAIEELKTLLQESHTLEEWENILYNNFGCEYTLMLPGIKPIEWLEKVQKQLENELHLAKGD